MVVDRILEQWSSLTLFFQHRIIDHKDLIARAIYNALKNPIFKMYLSFLSYVLNLISKLNLNLQSEQPKVPEMLDNLTTLYKCLLNCFIKKTVIEEKKLNEIVPNNPNNFLPLEELYLGAKVDVIEKDPNLNIPPTELHNFKLRCLDFLIEVSIQIRRRFNFEDPHLMFASNFIPNKIINGSKRSITEWYHLFPYLKLDLETVNTEWQIMCEMANSFNESDVTSFWRQIAKTKNELAQPMFPNLMVIVKIVLCLPHSSAAAERVFSSLNLIKNRVRNRLKISTCNSILHVKQSVYFAKSVPKWEPKYFKGQNLINDTEVDDLSNL